MRTTLAFAALLASCATVIAAPTKGDGFIGQNHAEEHESGGQEYVVLFNSSEATPPNAQDILKRVSLSEDHDDVRYTFNNSVFHGFVANMKTHCIDALNAMADVAHVEQAADIQSFITQRKGAPWGLQRISNAAGASGSDKDQGFTYSYDATDDTKLGAGVDVYIIDTGVRTSHAVFGGRAKQGFSFSSAATDGDGHGTHVAGTAAGTKFGVASGANVYAVKVLGDNGSGSSADTVAGMNWVINMHNERKKQPGFVGSIMSMSWGLQGIAKTVDDIVVGATQAGIHVSVAAGNDGKDACQSTPSHNGGANSAVVTVGSINIQNQISSFSNTGSCVDIYAPGENIVSSWSTGDNIINFLSGTSMACPHVTGVMAYMIAQDTSLGQDPAKLKAKLLQTARSNAITGNADSGDQKKLLSNGVDAGLQRLVKDWVVVDPEDDIAMPQEKRTVSGSVASWAKELVGLEVGKRWQLHSRDAQLRY
ncbi:oryzin precursor [Zopfia rhizophila CBS 207.26]|uniref:Oryzin n=1 Tax=Zopfia rhizophila CBS 207.26 TaxID=1314779 RepID=A0A6A6E7U2_9PEZI|nr:oryzin precursor [Zopfia rhizophila CBS 207.26]